MATRLVSWPASWTVHGWASFGRTRRGSRLGNRSTLDRDYGVVGEEVEVDDETFQFERIRV